MLLPDPPLPLAQSMEFKAGETFSVRVNVDEDDICFELDSVFIEVCDSDGTPAGRSYMDIATTVPTSSAMVNHVSLEPLWHIPSFPFMFTTLPLP